MENNISNNSIVPNITVHHYKNLYSNSFLKSKKLTFKELVEYLSDVKVSDDKYGNGTYVLGEMKDTHRNDENVLNRHALALDIDDLQADTSIVQDIENMFSFSYILYSTFSHKTDKPRYRLIIPLSKPIEKMYYKPAIKFFEKQFGVKVDEKSFTWSQCMARPVKQSDDADFIFQYQDSHYIDTDTLISGLEPYMDSGVGFTVNYSNKRDDSHWDIAYGQLKEGEGRNNACTSLVGLLLRRYIPLKVTVALIQHWNNSLIDPLSEKELSTIIKSVVKIETKRRGEQVL
ncbi:primase C-terminal domain-containing protein [Macrococcus armenti]|uniref:primase C-terminal domain-containing protein n=1 Tax=Macrococcus armenti TaxID=2875764 RepID=UPI001CCFF146|nr:primase C-terminal domain-containing protein [Macrococcus armenti]UBH15013.1 primase C-terminal domain-containing protein [Macrococcus armenti]UBH17372.1 primase C-terminal domain-containing protein [Macrococcus armenti]UBH19637.1 primase C-terminal domain-containing protein [Macrococcus armenti]